MERANRRLACGKMDAVVTGFPETKFTHHKSSPSGRARVACSRVHFFDNQNIGGNSNIHTLLVHKSWSVGVMSKSPREKEEEESEEEEATPLTPFVLDVEPLSFQRESEEHPGEIEALTDWLAKTDFKDAVDEQSSPFLRRAASESDVEPMIGTVDLFSLSGSYIGGQAISETDYRQQRAPRRRSRSTESFRKRPKRKTDSVSLSMNPEFSSDESHFTSLSLGTWNSSKGSPPTPPTSKGSPPNAFFCSEGALKSDAVSAHDNTAVSTFGDAGPPEEVTSSAIVAGENAPTPIVRETDLQDISSYFYEVMAEMQTCSFRPSDVIAKRPKLNTGHPGLECRHCRGAFSNQGRFFITQNKTFSDRTKSIDTFYRHLQWCKTCPQDVKDRLKRRSYTHASEIQEIRAQGKKKCQKVFLDTIWGRLHSSEMVAHI